MRIKSRIDNKTIPYGRGAKAIALQVKAETGTKVPLSQLESELTEMVTAWKEVTYPEAWAYMVQCGEQVTDPGYIVNPWGRYRRFPRKIRDKELSGFKREAQNYPRL